MSFILQAVLLFLAVILLIAVLHGIRRQILTIRYSLGWMILSLVVMILMLFPSILRRLGRILFSAEQKTPSELVLFLLAGLIGLVILVFQQSVQLSRQAEQIKRLVQELSLEKFMQGKQHEEYQENEEYKEKIYEKEDETNEKT